MRQVYVLILSACALVGLAVDEARAETYAGRATVIDGDTIYVGSAGESRKRVRLRFYGIDAPERKQVCANASGTSYACGQNAADELRRLIGSEPVTCEAVGSDESRPLVRCTAGGVDLNGALVESGWAVVYRFRDKPVSDEYMPAEAAARSARRGLWSGSFVMPWKWRAEHK